MYHNDHLHLSIRLLLLLVLLFWDTVSGLELVSVLLPSPQVLGYILLYHTQWSPSLFFVFLSASANTVWQRQLCELYIHLVQLPLPRMSNKYLRCTWRCFYPGHWPRNGDPLGVGSLLLLVIFLEVCACKVWFLLVPFPTAPRTKQDVSVIHLLGRIALLYENLK